MKTESLPQFAIDVSPHTRLYAHARQLPAILGEFVSRDKALKVTESALTQPYPIRVPFHALTQTAGNERTFIGELTVSRLANIV